MTAPAPDHTAAALDADGRVLLAPEEVRVLLRTCFRKYATKLGEMAHTSLEMAGDLFEARSEIPDGEVEAFRRKRGEWQERFVRTLAARFERRLSGEQRQGRRPDAEALVNSLRVLTAFDHEKQAALAASASALGRLTRREIAALDLRVAALQGGTPARDLDNPFSIDYLLDALGSTSRAVYPNPRVWRPLMERLLADMTPGMNKLYMSLNRMLADRGVLPDVKAALRARSEHRPQDDRELFATFTRLLVEGRPAAVADIAVPELRPAPVAAPGLVFATDAPLVSAATDAGPPTLDARAILDRLAALATAAGAAGQHRDAHADAPASHAESAAAFPTLDPLLALGTSSALFATLAHWQRLDLAAALASGGPGAATGAGETPGTAGALAPLNLVPYIRTAIAGQMVSDTDPITIDVIALLFDYIFRDPSIPPATRALFARLEVPIVKAALLDRTFFSDDTHPARRLLDHLAEAAVGAASDDDYRDAFTHMATGVIDRICADFEVDVAIFETADARLAEFVEAERRDTSTALFGEVAAALATEESEADRSAARAALRDRLAGTEMPFGVRSFIETTWSEYLADIRRQHGEDSEPWNSALATVDDLLWSIVVKERTGQKARLTKMIPTLVASLRIGCDIMHVPPDRARTFLDALYDLHMAAIKPQQQGSPTGPDDAAPGAVAAMPTPAFTVHDYVNEMAVGTWLAFAQPAETVHARLTWISPLRTRYIFTSHSSARAFVRAPEELAYELGSGRASLLVEPVALWDRAVSAALDTIAGSRPSGKAISAA